MGKQEDIERMNKEIAARFHKIETDMAGAETIAGLFEILFDRIEKEFDVPFVWLTLADAADAVPLAEAVKASDILKNRFCIVSGEMLGKILPQGLNPVLANKDLTPFYKLMPSSQKYFVRSVAVVPFALDGRIVGTWNNGDARQDRYSADMDASLLAGLARRISLQLTQLAAGKSGVAGKNRDKEQPGGLHG